LLKQVGNDCILLAVRGCDAAQEALCLMLEWRLLPNEEARLQIVNALESTDSGKERYAALCQRQKNLQELVSSRFGRRGDAENCFASCLKRASALLFQSATSRSSIAESTETVAYNAMFLFDNNATGAYRSSIRFCRSNRRADPGN